MYIPVALTKWFQIFFDTGVYGNFRGRRSRLDKRFSGILWHTKEIYGNFHVHPSCLDKIISGILWHKDPKEIFMANNFTDVLGHIKMSVSVECNTGRVLPFIYTKL